MPKFRVIHTSPDAEYIESGRNAVVVAQKIARSVGRLRTSEGISPIHRDGAGAIFQDDQGESVYIYPAHEVN